MRFGAHFSTEKDAFSTPKQRRFRRQKRIKNGAFRRAFLVPDRCVFCAQKASFSAPEKHRKTRQNRSKKAGVSTSNSAPKMTQKMHVRARFSTPFCAPNCVFQTHENAHLMTRFAAHFARVSHAKTRTKSGDKRRQETRKKGAGFAHEKRRFLRRFLHEKMHVNRL